MKVLIKLFSFVSKTCKLLYLDLYFVVSSMTCESLYLKIQSVFG